MASTPIRFRRTRAFCAAFMLTLCLVLIGGGFLLADANTRAVTFGDGSLTYAAAGGDYLRYAMGGDTASSTPMLWDLLPARVRAVTWILEWERTVAGWLIRF